MATLNFNRIIILSRLRAAFYLSPAVVLGNRLGRLYVGVIWIRCPLLVGTTWLTDVTLQN